MKGQVAKRLSGKDNPKLATGSIEVKATEMQVLNRCPTPPFEVTEFPGQELANEDLRMQYRYLDLRRPSLQRTLTLRHRLNKVIRDHLDARDFLEVETPLLGRSTPEGARDYLVPSRLYPGNWYALPQSPQLYKQLLMVAGYDKYFQIARCLRDEDLRANRQPEFTQLDLEMSFVDVDDILAVIEGLTAEVFAKCIGVHIPLPLPRLKYADAMLRYGSDKPDLRYGLEIVDLGDLAAQSEFKVFRGAVEAGGKVRGSMPRELPRSSPARRCRTWRNMPNVSEPRAWHGSRSRVTSSPRLSRNFCRCRSNWVSGNGSRRLRGTCCSSSPTTKKWSVRRWATSVRIWASALGLYDPAMPEFKIAWVVDFPLFVWDKDEKLGRQSSPIHCALDEDLDHLESDAGKCSRQGL